MSTEDTHYTACVEGAVKRALTGGARTLTEVCHATQGAFPGDIVAAIKRLTGRSPTGGISLYDSSPSDDTREGWPEPSPMDYEWRFTPASAREIATHAAKLGTAVACIGTPTVFASLLVSGRQAVLVDRNPFVVKSLSARSDTVVQADVADLPQALDGSRFPVIVMDPPWYPDYIEFWLSRAITIAADHATLVLTLFRELVRPGAGPERDSLMTMLSQLGSVELLQGSVTYETPLFEREVLLALGLPSPATWRMADLAIVRLEQKCPRLVVDRPEEGAWDRFLFGSQVVGLRRTADRDGLASVQPLYDDGSFLLGSISARDPRRGMIGVWTSRNRVARVTGTERMRSFLAGLSTGSPPPELLTRYARTPDEEHALRLLTALIGW